MTVDQAASFAVSLANVAFGYSAHDAGQVIRDVSLDVGSGSLVALSGPNGGGKTTLLNIIAGVLSPRSGAVEICGRPVGGYSRRELARKVALMPQYLPYSPWLTVREIVELGRYAHLPRYSAALGIERRSEKDDAIARAMDLSGVAHLADKLSGEISGGELRRTHLARVMAQDAEVMLLDEPTSDLDIEHQAELLAILSGLAAEGRAVIAVTHDLNFAYALGGRLVLLDKGKIAASGGPREILSDAALSPLYHDGFRVVDTADGGRAVLLSNKRKGGNGK